MREGQFVGFNAIGRVFVEKERRGLFVVGKRVRGFRLSEWCDRVRGVDLPVVDKLGR